MKFSNVTVTANGHVSHWDTLTIGGDVAAAATRHLSESVDQAALNGQLPQRQEPPRPRIIVPLDFNKILAPQRVRVAAMENRMAPSELKPNRAQRRASSKRRKSN